MEHRYLHQNNQFSNVYTYMNFKIIYKERFLMKDFIIRQILWKTIWAVIEIRIPLIWLLVSVVVYLVTFNITNSHPHSNQLTVIWIAVPRLWMFRHAHASCWRFSLHQNNGYGCKHRGSKQLSYHHHCCD